MPRRAEPAHPGVVATTFIGPTRSTSSAGGNAVAILKSNSSQRSRDLEPVRTTTEATATFTRVAAL